MKIYNDTASVMNKLTFHWLTLSIAASLIPSWIVKLEEKVGVGSRKDTRVEQGAILSII